jgi:hypothetical protein
MSTLIAKYIELGVMTFAFALVLHAALKAT